MKTTIAIIISLGLALTGADTLLASASSPELSSAETKPQTSERRIEGAFRPISHAPGR